MSRVTGRFRQALWWLVVIPGIAISHFTSSIWVLAPVGAFIAADYWWSSRDEKQDEHERGAAGPSDLVTMTGRRRLFSRGPIPAAEPQRVWLPPLDFRIAFPLIAVAFLAALFYPFQDVGAFTEDPITNVALLIGCLYVAIVPFRNRLELHPDALYVWTLTRVRRIALGDVADVQSGDNGLSITTRNGRVITSWLIGEKFRPERKRRTRADRLADEVRALVMRGVT